MVTFEMINHKPFGGEISTLADHVINCLCICLGISWEEGYQLMLWQAGQQGLMPGDAACAFGLLKSLSFYRERLEKELFGSQMEPVIKSCSAQDSYGLIYANKGWKNYSFMAVLKAETKAGSGGGLCMYGADDLRLYRVSLYLCNEDTARRRLQQIREEMSNETLPEHKPEMTASGESGEMPYQKSHEYFQYYQPNPLGRRVGDCVVRAFSAVFEIGWQEAVQQIGEAVGYSDAMVNGNLVFINMLIKNDYERHPQLKRNGRLLTGKEFCDEMSGRYKNGERIFAFVGSSHVAAVLPYREKDGSIHYKITDSWDCSDRKFGEYWVGMPQNKETVNNQETEDPAEPDEIDVGNSISHRRFGKGMVLSISAKGDDRILEIDFGDKGIKKLSEKWIRTMKGRR